jgi:hypothetical protein
MGYNTNDLQTLEKHLRLTLPFVQSRSSRRAGIQPRPLGLNSREVVAIVLIVTDHNRSRPEHSM